MNWSIVLYLWGYFFLFFSLCFLPSFSIAIYHSHWPFASIFGEISLGCIVVGMSLIFPFRKKAQRQSLTKKEALVSVSLIWLSAVTIGALPFLCTGSIPKPISALFESVSGFTTTGSSVVTDVEALAPSILFWRSFTHYLGGLGIVVMLVAIFPYLGIGARVLFQEESSVDAQELKPRIRDTAFTLLKIYLLFTLCETTLLLFFGMNLFDALCHTFGTLATGGFSTKNASIAHYYSLKIELTIILFMLLSAINFSLYYQIAKGRLSLLFQNTELKCFLSSVLLATLLITVHLTLYHKGEFWFNLRRSLFQVVSIHTATGFATDDYEQWTHFSKLVLLFLMLIGGSSGSTAGGIKIVRVVIVLKAIGNRLRQYFHPHATLVVRLNGRPLREEVVHEAIGLFCLWLLVVALASLALCFMGIDIETSLSSVITTMGGVGPGLGLVGPVENFSPLPEAAKGVLIVCMLLGRLEIYTLLVLCLPAFWKE